VKKRVGIVGRNDYQDEQREENARISALVDSVSPPDAVRLNVGDIITIAACFIEIPNPHRRWFTPWRPKMIASSELQRFHIASMATSR
jgi:hypothetical protein